MARGIGGEKTMRFRLIFAGYVLLCCWAIL